MEYINIYYQRMSMLLDYAFYFLYIAVAFWK